MKLVYIILLFAAISTASCNSNITVKRAAASDTLLYAYKTFKQRDTACGNNPDSACTIVKLSYPDFDNHAALNDSVTAKFIKLFAKDPIKADTSHEQLAANFIKRYTAFKKLSPKSTLYYLLDGKAKVLRQDSALLTIEISGFMYKGGGHGIDLTSYVNWNSKTDKSIKLDDIFISGYSDTLTRIAEQIFRKNEKISDTTSLTNGRTYFFKNNKFSLSNDFLITPTSIKFLYNVYTIKAFQAGKTYVEIPFSSIKSLLRPGVQL